MALADEIRKVLSNPGHLPPEFLDFMVQYVTTHSLPDSALRAPMMIATGTKGATKATRWVGSTSSGSPLTGYHQVGDFIITHDATIWICTVAGDPGTWVQVGGGGGGSTTMSWAAMSPGGSVTVSAGGAGSISTAVSQFYTNDSATFALSSVSGGYPAIEMLAGGHYLVQATLIPSSAIADGVGYGVGPRGITDADESTFYTTPSTRIVPAGENAELGVRAELAQTIQWTNIQSLNDGFVSAPAKFCPLATNYHASGSITVLMYVVIYLLDSDTTFIG